MVAEGGVLICSHCQKPCGARVASSIEVASCGGRDIGNQGGTLVCTDASQKAENNADIPAGGYRDSCGSCAVDAAGQLTCLCQRLDYSWSNSALNINDCTIVANKDGQLACEDPTEEELRQKKLSGKVEAPAEPLTQDLSIPEDQDIPVAHTEL
eukprot:c18984_g1_i1.p1 GENE.c18984_g1_i1~~c18984_g1_i1.p1  ORF type:complete len:154 (+),score=30.81 c18984_g1_i1:129-590(+)